MVAGEGQRESDRVRDKSEIKPALKTGLGLGMLAGLLESLLVLSTVDSPGDLGVIPALEVVFLGLFGVVCGIAPLVLSSQRGSDWAGLGAVSTARVATLLTTLFVAGQVNVHLSPVTLVWKRLALNLLCAAGGGSSGWDQRLPCALVQLSHSSRASPRRGHGWLLSL